MISKVIDVCSYQGTIDWNKCKKAGVDGAILKIIRKDLNPDTAFERNWKGCINAGIPVTGVYNYSYATTVAKAQKDARRVLEVLNGRKTVVWLDVEDNCQKGLGRGLIDIIKNYKSIIEGAGLEFGVYTGLSFYNTYIKPYNDLHDVGFWIAKYGTNAQRDISVKAGVAPTINRDLIAWQYGSRVVVNGVPTPCDCSEYYYNADPYYTVNTKPSTMPVDPSICPFKRPNTNIFDEYSREDAKWLQWHLNKRGHNLVVDGIIGKLTSEALVNEIEKLS